jgi:hypothetical protein
VPRKSRASLEIVPIEQHLPRIETPPGLSQEERELFERIVKQCGPTHFTNSDSPLLVAYVQNIILVDMCYQAALASPDRLPAWERAIKTLAMLARSLRLTPRSRVDPKTLTRSLLGLSQRETGGVSLEALDAIRDGGGTRGWTCRG